MKGDPQPNYADASKTPWSELQGKPSDSAEEANGTANYAPLGGETNGEAVQLDDGKEQFKHFRKSNMTIWGSEWQSNGRFPRIGIGINCRECGSSFFYQVIGQHPEIMTGVRKETKYFSADQSLNVCPQLPHGSKATTPMQRYVSRCFGKNSNGDLQHPWSTSEYGTLFEFTPDYLLDAVDNKEKVLQPLVNVYQDADVRFIALLCDPVLRFISELNVWRESQARWKGKTDAEMSAAVPGLLAEGREVIRQGHYAENLKEFRTQFAKHTILIVNRNGLEELTTWRHVFRFLGLESFTDEDTTVKHMIKDAKKHDNSMTHSKDGYLQLSKEAISMLKNHYADHDYKLWKLLEVEEPWW